MEESYEVLTEAIQIVLRLKKTLMYEKVKNSREKITKRII
jgi:hypothetical protein